MPTALSALELLHAGLDALHRSPKTVAGGDSVSYFVVLLWIIAIYQTLSYHDLCALSCGIFSPLRGHLGWYVGEAT